MRPSEIRRINELIFGHNSVANRNSQKSVVGVHEWEINMTLVFPTIFSRPIRTMASMSMYEKWCVPVKF
jgi:hypothetical protein